MIDRGNSRRAFLKASATSVTLTALSGCNGIFQERDHWVRYENAAAPGIAVMDVPQSDGPLLYATTITTRGEMEERLEWSAAYQTDTVVSVEDTDFEGLSFQSHFLVILVSAFNFQQTQNGDEMLPIEFQKDICTFPIELDSLPPLTPMNETGDPRYYFIHISAWSQGNQPVPEHTKIEISLTPSKQ